MNVQKRHFLRSTVAALREKVTKDVIPAIHDLQERVGEIEAMLAEMETVPRRGEEAA